MKEKISVVEALIQHTQASAKWNAELGARALIVDSIMDNQPTSYAELQQLFNDTSIGDVLPAYRECVAENVLFKANRAKALDGFIFKKLAVQIYEKLAKLLQETNDLNETYAGIYAFVGELCAEYPLALLPNATLVLNHFFIQCEKEIKKRAKK